MTEVKQPEALAAYQFHYYTSAWQQYTLQELGNWVHLFVKRAAHRSDPAKKRKDLEDAQNYLLMMQAHIDAAKGTI